MHTLEEYKLNYKKVQVSIDNISSIYLIKNSMHYCRTKYIKVKYHFVSDHIVNEDIVLKYVESKSNITSIFPKSLIEADFSILMHN